MKQPIPDLNVLVGLFYADRSDLGEFEQIEAVEAPQPYRQLLDHNEHMTVTLEAYHGCPVDVEAIEVNNAGRHYSRRTSFRRVTAIDDSWAADRAAGGTDCGRNGTTSSSGALSRASSVATFSAE